MPKQRAGRVEAGLGQLVKRIREPMAGERVTACGDPVTAVIRTKAGRKPKRVVPRETSRLLLDE